MSLPLSVLERIAAFAGWGASGRLVACAPGSSEIKKLRKIRSWIRAGFHGLAIPWTSLKSIADFAGIGGAANLVQTERGYDMMKLLRAVTAQTITRNHWAEMMDSWGASTSFRAPRAHEDSDDEEVAMWRRWVGDD